MNTLNQPLHSREQHMGVTALLNKLLKLLNSLKQLKVVSWLWQLLRKLLRKLLQLSSWQQVQGGQLLRLLLQSGVAFRSRMYMLNQRIL